MRERKPRSWWDDEAELPPADHKSIEVESVTEPRWTGLLDLHGRRLYAQVQPFGFRRG